MPLCGCTTEPPRPPSKPHGELYKVFYQPIKSFLEEVIRGGHFLTAPGARSGGRFVSVAAAAAAR